MLSWTISFILVIVSGWYLGVYLFKTYFKKRLIDQQFWDDK